MVLKGWFETPVVFLTADRSRAVVLILFALCLVLSPLDKCLVLFNPV